MSSDTLAHMLEHWDEISEGEGKIDLPFNIEEFCRENDHRIFALKAENKRLQTWIQCARDEMEDDDQAMVDRAALIASGSLVPDRRHGLEGKR